MVIILGKGVPTIEKKRRGEGGGLSPICSLYLHNNDNTYGEALFTDCQKKGVLFSLDALLLPSALYIRPKTK